MKVLVWLKETSQPIEFELVKNTYQKGDFYCVYAGQMVTKFPIGNIFRVVETYNK
jgi:hypothetical protein